MGTALGETAAVATLKTTLATLVGHFNADFLHANGTLDNGVQTTYSLPLHLAIETPEVTPWLTAAIHAENPYCGCKLTRVRSGDRGDPEELCRRSDPLPRILKVHSTAPCEVATPRPRH